MKAVFVGGGSHRLLGILRGAMAVPGVLQQRSGQGVVMASLLGAAVPTLFAAAQGEERLCTKH